MRLYHIFGSGVISTIREGWLKQNLSKAFFNKFTSKVKKKYVQIMCPKLGLPIPIVCDAIFGYHVIWLVVRMHRNIKLTAFWPSILLPHGRGAISVNFCHRIRFALLVLMLVICFECPYHNNRKSKK